FLFLFLLSLWSGFIGVNTIYPASYWQKEYDYYSVLKQAVTGGKTPYHITQEYQTTDRFLAIPEIDISPALLLLKWLEVPHFLYLNLVFMFLLGFLGLLLLKRKLKLGFLAFAFLALIFFLNGHLVAHIYAGHYMWTGFFLLPYFFLFLLELGEGKNLLSAAAKLSLTIFFIFITGGFHIAVWCLLLLFLTGLLNNSLRKYSFIALLLTALLLVFRLAPALFTYYANAGARVRGFYSIFNLLESLVVMHTPDFMPPGWQNNWLEYTTFIDIIGVAVLLYFGIYLSRKKAGVKDVFKPFYWPIGIIAILTLSKLGWMPVPPFNSEKVSTRMLIIPVLFLAVVSAVRLQEFLKKANKTVLFTVVSAVLLVMLFTSLFINMKEWTPRGAELQCGASFTSSAIKLKVEPLYKKVCDISFLISGASFLLVAGLIIAAGKKKSTRN
ncbi:MAG: 6-pyruvoyl-tetrahydropterin synthase-related protein, partial [Candidatus Firestonebacteria bacterium]